MAISAFDVKRLTIAEGNLDAEELFYNLKAAKELGHITTMTSLRRLTVAFNELTSCSGIQQLQLLHSLNLSHNALSSLNPVSALTCLTSLNVSCNRISSTSALQGLPTLRVLALHSNAIAQPPAVLLLSCLASLQHLSLAHNPVCQQSHWQEATIAALPGLQALDSCLISEAQRLAAQPHAGDWHKAVAAGGMAYASSSRSSSNRSSSNNISNGGDGSRESSTAGQVAGAGAVCSSRRQSGRNAAVRLAAAQPQSGEALGSMCIKDAAALLPSIAVAPMKPSTLAARPQQQQTASSCYGYSRQKPIMTVHQQRYQHSTSAAAAVLVRSDGSAVLQWPGGAMAATLDPDDSTPRYRLLAMYRNIVGVAASFDGSGGFVQYPSSNIGASGALMLVWNRKDGKGKCYSPDGAITHSFNSRKKPLGLQQDVAVQLDEHFSVRFMAGSYELQLFFSCEGCQMGLSLLHGSMLPDEQGSLGLQQQPPGAAVDGAVTPQPAVGEDTQELLARARELMAVDFADLAGPTGAGSQAAAGGTTHAANHAAVAVSEDDSAQQLLVRARALIATSCEDREVE